MKTLFVIVSFSPVLISLHLFAQWWEIGIFHLRNLSNVTQCAEMILNKIEKTFNKSYTGLKSFLQRFQICFSQNPSCKGMESTS